MSEYTLRFLPDALEEWRTLDAELKEQFLLRLAERLKHPRVPNAALHDMNDCYKIKLRAAKQRLVYRVINHEVVVEVIAVGQREGIYITASNRLH